MRMTNRPGEFESLPFKNWLQPDMQLVAQPDEAAPPEDLSRHTLTRLDLAHAIYEARPGLSRREANRLVDEVLDEITDALLSGETVRLHEFGKFVVAEKKSRPGRNPRTGEALPILARKVLRFHASPHLKDRVAGLPASKARA